MSLKQTAIEFAQFVVHPDAEAIREHRVMAAAYTPLSVAAGIVVGGVSAGVPLIDILICGLVAGSGVALFCAVAAWLFDAPMGPGLLGLWDDSGQLRPLRFRRSQHLGRPAPAHPAIRSRAPSQLPLVRLARRTWAFVAVDTNLVRIDNWRARKRWGRHGSL